MTSESNATGAERPNFVELSEGKHFWKAAETERGSFIIDGEAFFRAFREALMQAENYVCLLAWDLNGQIELLRGAESEDDLPTKLVDFLYALLDQKPELEIYILLWDYSVVYLAEREWLPFSRFRQDPHPRLHLETDSAINLGASHHQKVVVVDGGFAFCGGMDLSTWRWDTKAHLPEDERRVTPEGKPYQPYHDIHTALNGQAAVVLDELCRERWQRATGTDAPWQQAESANEVWPPSLEPDFEHTPTVFSLTYSAYKDYPAVTQIEHLHLNLIAAAERSIYIENQYLSSHRIADALIERLAEAEGPEVVIILTQNTGGWLEEGTLGLLRSRLLEKLTHADTYGRLGTYFPYVQDDSGNGRQVYVHAKIMICDDRAVMTGSANLSNRSMKVDSEVMLTLGLESEIRSAAKLLRRLLGMHLGTTPGEIDRMISESGSINRTILRLRENSQHQLRDLEAGNPGRFARKLADSQLLDPDEPIDLGYWLQKTLPESAEPRTRISAWWKRDRICYLGLAAGLILIVLVGLGLREAWGGMIDKDAVEQFFETVERSPWTLPILFSIFVIAGFTGISLNLLLVSATLAIGPWSALLCGFSGALLSAVATFKVGQVGGRRMLKRCFKDPMRRLGGKIRGRGILSVAVLRLVPVAPFNVINLVAGISGIRLRVFVIGTCLGMLPGMFGVVFVSQQAKSIYTNPNWQTWALLGLGASLLIGLTVGVRRVIR